MQIDMNRFRAAFYVEAAEHLQSMEAALLQLESATHDTELLNTVFRAAHSIKGASTTFGIDEVGRFTHVLETLLERLREGTVETSVELIELLLMSVDVIDGLVANAKDATPLPANLEDVLRKLQRANSQAGAAREEASPAVSDSTMTETSTTVIRGRYRVSLHPSRDFFRFGQDPLLLLRELHGLGTVLKIDVDDHCLPPLADMNPEDSYLAWTVEIETGESESALRDVFMFLDDASKFDVVRYDDGTQAKPEASSIQGAQLVPAKPDTPQPERRSGEDRRTSASAQRSSENETVRVDRQRLDELINQIGELVIGTSMVEQEVLSLAGSHGLDSMAGLGKIVRDLQELSLSLRMVPIAATFQKMNRVIRDVAKKVGKQIHFVTEGDDTELDKSIVDQISDPLVHMVRNSADHGIETPEERLAAGKPAEGVVTLRAFQQGGNIYLELTDDGRGLNRQRILSKAVERGLVAADANLSDSEICNLIFLPGFSTANEVTDISGRGVGMDVVRRNVEALQGSVTVKSVEGKGSTITVRLPLTLAILDGLLVRLTEEVFVIPLLSVVESICIRPSELRRIVNIGQVITLRGEVVPLIGLHRMLSVPEVQTDSDQVLLVIVEDQGRRLALKVDELLGQQQVVIKNLETNFGRVPGVAGATILGDGRVALILDVYGVSGLNSGDQLSVTRANRVDENVVRDVTRMALPSVDDIHEHSILKEAAT